MMPPLQNFTKRSVILLSDFLCFIVKTVQSLSNDGLNNAKFQENYGDFPPDMTMKTLSSAIAKNSRGVLKPLLKTGFTMALKSMEKYLIIFQEKGYHQTIGLKILPPYLMNLTLK
jgi:hypothetical protein